MSTNLPIILHIGGMKTGSSALQYALTWNSPMPSQADDRVRYEYVALHESGLVRGTALHDQAWGFSALYANSSGVQQVLDQGDAVCQQSRRELRDMLDAGTVPILSCETWLTAEAHHVRQFTELFGTPLHVIAYVRPPVPLIASLFWQTHTRPDFQMTGRRDRWLSRQIDLACWETHLRHWQQAPGVERLDVRLTPSAIVGEFLRELGCQPPADEPRHNIGYPAALARFVDTLDQSVASDLIELKFAWWRWARNLAVTADLPLLTDPSPFGLSDADIHRIIEATREPSAKLLDLLSEPDRTAVRGDPRWWSDTPLVHRPPDGAARDRADEAHRLLSLTLRALMAADTAWRHTRHQLALLGRHGDPLRPATAADGDLLAADPDWPERCEQLTAQREQLLVDRETLVAKLETLAAQNRWLAAERDALTAARDALGQPAPELSQPSAIPLGLRVRQWRRRLGTGARAAWRTVWRG